MLLHDLLVHSAERFPDQLAVLYKQESVSYSELKVRATDVAKGLLDIGLDRYDRVGVYLPKRPETVAAIFGVTMAGGLFVPVNPLLKEDQVRHILRDCGVRFLITSGDRLAQLAGTLSECRDVRVIVIGDADAAATTDVGKGRTIRWDDLVEAGESKRFHRMIDEDLAAVFYTSGSTGRPKGVSLSHRNMVCGAHSVAQYLENRTTDRLLAVLPFSFDYGFSQLSTAMSVGASVVLLDYLFPKDVMNAVDRHRISGLAGVPPLWNQLAKLEWSSVARESLRYLTNSGGAMPRTTLGRLREALPETKFYLMYGLTEAFRSTYLPPEEIDARPDSIGKAIPNAEVMVLREDGTQCEPGEAGELVHRGALVSHGYWSDPETTAIRFRPLPPSHPGTVRPEVAVWSGDTVTVDEDGYLYFVERRDEMIKTSGYRVSPTEIEEVVFSTGIVTEVLVVGVPHPELGQGIAIVFVPSAAGHDGSAAEADLLGICRDRLPNYMVPGYIEARDSLPRNPNGKIDRTAVRTELLAVFESRP